MAKTATSSNGGKTMASTAYRIMAADNYGGDDLEKRCWPLFLQQDFPSYETFWRDKVVPVTTRPHGMGFRSDAELANLGRGAHDMAIAQLHYTILAHLDVAYRYRAIHPLEAENFTHTIVRLSSATDVADEILERLAQPGTYDPWSEADGGRARRTWRGTHQQLQDIRDYRNRLVHDPESPRKPGALNHDRRTLAEVHKYLTRFGPLAYGPAHVARSSQRRKAQ
jgi:hypothetical protein